MVLRRLRKRLLGIDPAETSCQRRGFHIRDTTMAARIEQIGQSFLHGYHAALDDSAPAALARRLDMLEPAWRGFAYEGAGMALTLLDLLSPWRRGRLAAFLDGPGAPYTYLIHVGAGWTLGRLPIRPERLLRRLDPLLGWLALDGYGFHEGYFNWPRSVRQHRQPARLDGYTRHVFDQGLGRSLWFVECGDIGRIITTVASFPAERRADLWSGVGLACTYAGGADRPALEQLHAAAGPHQPALAQGAAFAAEARRLPQNTTPASEIACTVLCGLPLEEAARTAVHARVGLPLNQPARAYALWRQRIAQRFEQEVLV